MCGIAGLIADKERVVRQALTPMVSAQKHRGPDDEGQTIEPFGHGFIGLGFRRLSIIDLSAAGHQPMIHPQTGDQIVFNGEIYNFLELRSELEKAGEVFFGRCDTEVLLRALTRWGVDALKRIEGMYALAFLNKRENRLVLARDPVGIKPLYVAEATVPDCGKTLLFASEMRALLASGLVERKLDIRGVATLLAYGVTQQPETIFRRIRSVMPGTYEEYVFHCTPGEPYKACGPARSFWSFPRADRSITPSQAAEAVRVTLDAAIQRHKVADVPVGVFLSSGLDSTIIAGLTAKHTPRLRSFTVSLADHPDISEHAIAADTARLLGLEHTAIDLGDTEALRSARGWLDSLDRPSVDGLNVYVISKVVRAHGIVVALSVQGGDELFGGYPSFEQVPKLRRMMARIRWLPGSARVMLARLLTMRRSMAQRQKLDDIMRGNDSILRLGLQRRRAMSDEQMHVFGLDAGRLGLTDDFQPYEALEGLMPGPQLDPDDIVWSVSQVESRFYQGNMLLRDSDTNSMAHGLELRVPMLDKRMLDLVYSIPGDVRLPDHKADKHLARVAFGDLLREDLLNRGKTGFALPIAQWMQGPLRDLCEEGLRYLKSLDLMRSEGIDEVWRTFLSDPHSPIWSRAFTLCVLGHFTNTVKATA